ncbi:MAG: bifunctional heptose 7-phosphate kinase/heptose 1-phosphate adenyltransferase [Bacteroidia bacterium]
MSIINRFEGLKALIIGDVMIDAYLFGKVERISPEAPVPIVAVTGEDKRLGGAGNVAMNIKALGAIPILCSVIGKDAHGDTLLHLLQQQGIQTSGIIQSAERITTSKTRVIGQNTQMLRIDREITDELSDYETFVFSQKIINDLLPAADVVIFEDYDKGVITKHLIELVVAAAKKHHKPVAVDPKKRNFMHYHGVTLFKPNLKELREGYKRDISIENKGEFELTILELMKETGIENCFVTLSEHGVSITNGNGFTYIPAHLRKIADVSGAGDTVISVAGLCLALGLSNEKIAQLANLAGGLVCEEIGVVPINKDKLIAEANRLNLNE